MDGGKKTGIAKSRKLLLHWHWSCGGVSWLWHMYYHGVLSLSLGGHGSTGLPHLEAPGTLVSRLPCLAHPWCLPLCRFPRPNCNLPLGLQYRPHQPAWCPLDSLMGVRHHLPDLRGSHIQDTNDLWQPSLLGKRDFLIPPPWEMGVETTA